MSTTTPSFKHIVWIVCLVAFAALFHHTESYSFGTVFTIDDNETHQVTSIKVRNSLESYATFKTDNPSATLLSNSLGSVTVSSAGRTIVAKFDSLQQQGYHWATGIDSGVLSYVPYLLPSCDNQSIIIVFPNCTGSFPQFGISDSQGAYAVIAKYDSQGRNVWFKLISQSSTYSGDVIVSNAHISCDSGVDSVFLVGPLNNAQLAFDCPSKNQQADVSAYVAKFNQTGDCVWASAWTNSTVTAVSSDSQYIFVAGAFMGEAHFKNSYFTQKNTSLNDIYVFNVNKISGAFIRGTQISAFYSGSVLEVVSADANSFYMVTNLFWRIGDLPTILLLKGSKTGPSLAWSEFVLSPSDYISFVASDMETTKDGSILLTGWCNGNGTINGTFSNICETGSQTGFVARYDSNGDCIEILTVENYSAATGIALSVGSDNYVLAMGRSEAPSTIGSGQRNFTGTNKFNFVVELLEGPSIYCYGTNKYEPSVCSGNGNCEATDTCTCQNGYIDDDCSQLACFNISSGDANVCSVHGQCIGPDLCLCDSGYAGRECELYQDPFTFEVPINGSGTISSCMVPYYSPKFIPGIIVTNFTWLFIQDGAISEKITYLSLPQDYSPTHSNIHHGTYHVVGELYYQLSGVTVYRNASVLGRADCSICFAFNASNCRYRFALSDITLRNNIANGSTTSINRMKSYGLILGSEDLATNSEIAGLQLDWETSILSQETNIRVVSSNSSFIISPLDSMGMSPIDINITLQLKIPYLEWQVMSFTLKILASKDITPQGVTPLIITPHEGYSLKDRFNFHAVNWLYSGLIYSFSYQDPFTRDYVRFGESRSPFINAGLPPVFTNSVLSIRLKVFNPDNGDYGSTEQQITVKPSFVAGLLSQKLDESIATDDYTTTLAIASHIRGATPQEIEANISEMKDIIHRVLEYTATRLVLDSVSIEQQLIVVDMVTTNELLISNQEKGTALNIASHIIDVDLTNSSISSVSSSGYQRITNIISNIAVGGFTNKTVAQQAVQTGENLAKLIASRLVVGEPPANFIASDFKVTVVVDRMSRIANTTIQTNGSTIDSFYIPSQFATNVNSDTVSTSILVFQDNPYENQSNGSFAGGVSSPIIDIKFNSLDGSLLVVANLTQPLLINFNRSKAKQQGACPEATFQCRYWSAFEHKWKTDGCYWIGNESDEFISCACNHTTSFSAFVLEKGDSCVVYAGIKMTDIIFNSLYLLICVPILIGLFITNKQQPMRSRYIAPFLGMIAIIVDSVVQGLIRNSLSLAQKKDASDVFSHVIMLTANPLFVTALFVFLWQQVRFLLLQNIYYLMPSANNSSQKNFIRLNRVLASKALFVIVTVFVGSLVLSCFAVFVGLASHYNNTGATEKRNTVVIAQAVVFAALLFIVSIGILITLTIDAVFSVKQESAPKRTLDDHTHNQQVHIKRAKGLSLIKNHFRNDPLLFRTEAVMILATVFLLIVLYSIGIATLVQHSKAMSPIMIVRTICEILFMFARILAFGGYILMASIRNVIRGRRLTTEHQSLSSATLIKETIQDQMVLEVLRHSSGYHLVFDFCRKEFSLENLLLWRELETIRTANLLMTIEERRKSLTDIQGMYIDNNSERQLNISNQRKKLFLKVSNMSEPSAADAEEAFALLYGACVMNIADTMTRLRSTEEFRFYEQAKNISIELRDNCFAS